MTLYFFVLFNLLWCSSIQTQPNLTFDEFFDSPYFPSLSLSPNGEHLLVHRRRPAWDSNTYENSLWLYETQGQGKKLITPKMSEIIKPRWSPSGDWFVFIIDDNTATNSRNDRHLTTERYLHLYNIHSDQLLPVNIGNQLPFAVTWSHDDSSLYFVTMSIRSITDEEDNLYQTKWKDVIQHRQPKQSDSNTIYRLDINRTNQQQSVSIHPIKNVNFSIGELLFVPSEEKLIFTTRAMIIEDLADVEMYSIDLCNVSSLSQLTFNEGFEQTLQLSSDGKHVFFRVYTLSPSNGKYNNTQERLYCVDVTNGHIERWGKDFDGNIVGYADRPDGGVYFLGQWGTNIQIYIQQSLSKYSVLQRGWDGSYQGITSASLKGRAQSAIAFLHSSFNRPEEVYFADQIDRLRSAKAITSENQLFTQRNLPRAKLYTWINDEDHRTIEGILHYPPGQFEEKNLPLFVFIHGGPNDASVNLFHGNWLTWAPLAATEGWLVFEPNYRGSTGYGDSFLSEVRFEVLTQPGRDILAGVDQLIADGIADPNRLTIGGFSYGGFLTNWLITQTTRFNAAVSGAGAVEQVLMWGRSDTPLSINGIMGGYPWEIPQRYWNESAIYQLGKVRTPTHIVTGANDIRVPADQSLILERGLHYLGVPTKLLLFPNQGHSLRNFPWHGKIKVREELKWLKKYGHSSSLQNIKTSTE